MGAPNTAPFEIIAAPFTLWLAPVGTAFPVIDAAPAGSWVKVGTNGDLNYDEEGVTVEHGQKIDLHRGLGSTGPLKAFRPEEMLVISMKLIDLSLEQYALALNHNAVTTDAAGVGDAGDKTIPLLRGLTVTRKALLVRGPSPYGDNFFMQYSVPIVVITSSPKPVFAKNKAAGLELEFTALQDVTNGFGLLEAQTAAAS